MFLYSFPNWPTLSPPKILSFPAGSLCMLSVVCLLLNNELEIFWRWVMPQFKAPCNILSSAWRGWGKLLKRLSILSLFSGRDSERWSPEYKSVVGLQVAACQLLSLTNAVLIYCQCQRVSWLLVVLYTWSDESHVNAAIWTTAVRCGVVGLTNRM